MNSAGSMASPLIVRPMLLPSTLGNGSLASTEINATLHVSETTQKYGGSFPPPVGMGSFLPSDVRVQYAFLVPGTGFAVCFLVHALMFGLNGCSIRSANTHKPSGAAEKETLATPWANRHSRGRFRVSLVLSLFALMSGAVGAVIELHGMFLFIFVVKHLMWLKKDAVMLNTVMLFGQCSCQLVFSVVARFLRPPTTTLILILAVSVPSVVLATPAYDKVPVLWACVIIIAIGLGCLVATIISWMSDTFTINGKLMSLLYGSVYGSRIAVSWSVGVLFDVKGPLWLLYVSAILAVAASFACVGIRLLTETTYCSGDPAKRMIRGVSKEEQIALKVI